MAFTMASDDGNGDSGKPGQRPPVAVKVMASAVLRAAVAFALFAGGAVILGHGMAELLGPSLEPAEFSLSAGANTSAFLYSKPSNIANASAASIVDGGARTLQARRLSTAPDPPPSGFSVYCNDGPSSLSVYLISPAAGCPTTPTRNSVASIVIDNPQSCSLSVGLCSGNDISSCNVVSGTGTAISSSSTPIKLSNVACPKEGSVCGWYVVNTSPGTCTMTRTMQFSRDLGVGIIVTIVISCFLQIWWIVCLLHWCGCIDAPWVEKVWCFPFCCCYPCCCKDRYEVRRKKKIMDMMSQAAMASGHVNPVHSMANAYAAQNSSIAVSPPGYSTQQPQPLQQPPQQQSVQQPVSSLTAPWPSPGGFDASTRIASFR
jgi:hypothetical protein